MVQYSEFTTNGASDDDVVAVAAIVRMSGVLVLFASVFSLQL